MKIREIRKEDFDNFIRVYCGAYPGVDIIPEKMAENLEKRLESKTSKTLVAEGDDGRILGGYTLYDFEIYQNYNELTMGGIGSVCVALDSKKQGVAKALIMDALQRMQEKNISTSILYPFRHDFYQKMGWGQVGEVKEYMFNPNSLPIDERRLYVRRSYETDLEGISVCYDRFARAGNCLAKRSERVWQFKLKNPNIFVFEKDGEIQGYLQVAFEKGNGFLDNVLKIEEMIYNTQDAYFGLLSYIASQLDQFDNVLYYASCNEPFHILLAEPRRDKDMICHLYKHSQKVGIGWMFRLVDVERSFLSRMNYHGVDLEVTFEVEDSFLPVNSGMYKLILTDGKPQVIRDQKSECVIKLDISVLSQLFANYITFSEAASFEKVVVNDLEIIPVLDRAFSLPTPRMLEFF